MPREDKVAKVEALTDRFRSAAGAVFVDYRGLTVKDMSDLRGELRRADATFSVSKNTLTQIAAREAGLEGVVGLLEGPTAVAFLHGDAVAGAKALLEAARRFPAMAVRGSLVEGHVYGEDDTKALADLDSREVSVAKVAGMLQAPLSRTAFLLQAPLQRIAWALGERARQGEAA